MNIILHHCHEARSMRSLWLLNELGLEFELVIHPFDRLRTEEYLDIHPLGRVPTIQIDGMTLFESGAICQYLCEKYSPDVLGRTPGHPERASWLQWLHYSETMAVHGAALVQQFVVLQDEALRSPIIQKLESRRLQKALEVLDQQFNNSDYLLQTGFSAVDIAVGYSVHLAQNFLPLSDYANVDKYYNILCQRDAFQKSMPEANAQLKIFNKDMQIES